MAYAVTQLIVWVVPLLLWAASAVYDEVGKRWGRQFLLVAFGGVLFLFTPGLHIFQVALGVVRTDPFCPFVQTYGVPSSAAFYVGATVAFFVGFAWIKGFWYSVINSMYLLAWFSVPPLVLIWVGVNTWQEVLVSLLLAALVTAAFLVVMVRYVAQDLPYLLLQAPCTWFNCTDTWLQTEVQRRKGEQLRRRMEQDERVYGSLDVLCC